MKKLWNCISMNREQKWIEMHSLAEFIVENVLITATKQMKKNQIPTSFRRSV